LLFLNRCSTIDLKLIVVALCFNENTHAHTQENTAKIWSVSTTARFLTEFVTKGRENAVVINCILHITSVNPGIHGMGKIAVSYQHGRRQIWSLPQTIFLCCCYLALLQCNV